MTNMDFSCALKAIKLGRIVHRINDDSYYQIQLSETGKPYLYMIEEYKGYGEVINNGGLGRFPIDLTSEDVLATDWCAVDKIGE